MTVESTTRRAGPYLGNGVTTSFPFDFKVFSTSDIALTVTDADGIATALVLDTDYSIALNPDQDSDPGGWITYPLSGDPLATGETLVGVGSIPYDQTTDLPSGGPYRAATVESAFDRTVFQIQQLAEAQGRSLALPPSAATADTELPAPVALNVIGWNETADGLVNYTPADLATVVATGTSYFDVFNGDGAQTQFVLTANPGSVNALDVALDGVPQKNGIDFTASGTTLTFTSAPGVGTQNIAVRYVAAVPVGSANAQDVTFLQAGTGAVSRVVQDELRETLKVTQFGVDMTGATDSTTKFVAALTAAAALTAGGKGVTVYIPTGVVTLSGQISVPDRVKIRGAGSRSTIVNSNFAGPAFLLAGVQNCEIGCMRIGLSSSALASAISVTTPGNVDSRKHRFPDLEIAAPSLISGQVGISMVATGTGIITECHMDAPIFDQIDQPIYVRGSEGNFITNMTVDGFGAAARSAIDSIGLVNTYSGRIAGSPAAGSVGYKEAGLRNIADLIVDIGAGATALDLNTGSCNIVRLQRPELLTPIGAIGVSNTVFDSENAIVKRVCAHGTAPTAPNFSLSAGWGSTATVTSITGKDQRVRFTVNSSGVGQAANPTLGYSFADGTWGSSTPMPQVTRDGGNQISVNAIGSSGNSTGWGFTFGGTPVAGETYVFVVTVG